MKSLESELAGAVENNLKTAMARAEQERPIPQKMPAAPQASPVARLSPQPLVRMAESLNRVQRLAEEMDRASDQLERQLKIIKEVL